MKRFAKLLSFAAAALIALSAAGCGSEPADINVAVLKGPTGVGMASLMDSAADRKLKNPTDFAN